MSLKVPSSEEVSKAAQREDLIRETARQIIKDFSGFDLEVNFSGEVTDFYNELFGQLQQHVTNLLSMNGEKFFNLLYRIDIDPNDIDNYQRQMPQVPLADVITELIIHRELKKILIRDYFRRSGY